VILGFFKLMLTHFKSKNGFFKRCEAFSSNVRHLKKFSEKWEAFDYKCEAFIKVTRLFEDIFRKMKDLIRNLRLFQRLRGFLKTFSMKLRLL
jgi:hypothetical protein